MISSAAVQNVNLQFIYLFAYFKGNTILSVKKTEQNMAGKVLLFLV